MSGCIVNVLCCVFIGGVFVSVVLVLFGVVCVVLIDKIKVNGVLCVVVYCDFEFWLWKQDGKIVGIDVDIVDVIVRKLGVCVEVVDFLVDEGVDDDLCNMVWCGLLVGGMVCDVMMYVLVDCEFVLKNDCVVICVFYYCEGFQMVCGIDIDCEVVLVVLKGSWLVVEFDSIFDFYLLGLFGGVLCFDVKYLISGQVMIDVVKNGEVDVVMVSCVQIEYVFYKGSVRVKVWKGLLLVLFSFGWDVGVVVKDDSCDLVDLFDMMIVGFCIDGIIDVIFVCYGVLVCVLLF